MTTVTKTANGNEAVIFMQKNKKEDKENIMKKKIAELYYTTFRNHLSKEEKAEVKFMLSIFKDKRITHCPYITGSEKVRNVAYELGYQVATGRNEFGYYEVYPNTVF